MLSSDCEVTIPKLVCAACGKTDGANPRLPRFLKTQMNILEQANKITSGDRHLSYGHPGRDFRRVAELWSAFLGVQIKPEHVPIMMILVKVSREANKHKLDNLTDIAGYARTLEMLLYENPNKNSGSDIRRPSKKTSI